MNIEVGDKFIQGYPDEFDDLEPKTFVYTVHNFSGGEYSDDHFLVCIETGRVITFYSGPPTKEDLEDHMLIPLTKTE